MAKYIFGYHGQPLALEAAPPDPAVMAAWERWFRGMGRALVDIGNPAGPSKVIGASGHVRPPDGVGLTGYTIVSADSLQDAMKLTEGCPIFAAGGSIEVAELIPT